MINVQTAFSGKTISSIEKGSQGTMRIRFTDGGSLLITASIVYFLDEADDVELKLEGTLVETRTHKFTI